MTVLEAGVGEIGLSYLAAGDGPYLACVAAAWGPRVDIRAAAGVPCDKENPMLVRTRLDVGDTNEVAWAIRNSQGELVTPPGITVTIRDPTGDDVTIDATDTRLTLGATVSTGKLAELGITETENTAGVGIVRLDHEPTAAGRWQYRGRPTGGTVDGSETVIALVRPYFT